jgi:hypothetical protein
LLAKRLRELEAMGIVTRRTHPATGDINYATTPMADELEPIVHAFGLWAHRNIDAAVTLEKLDARVLMWNMRRKIDALALPAARRTVIQFIYPDLPKDEQSYWILSKPGAPVDLCLTDPGHDVDLYVTADLRAMTSAWMGYSRLHSEIARGRITLIGDAGLASTIDRWMVRSSYALEAERSTSCTRADTAA